MKYQRFVMLALLWSVTVGGVSTYGTGSQALAMGDSTMSTCSRNESLEGFSTSLPDCRAYELVSPPFKGGLQIQAVVGLAVDGTHLVGESLGAFAGVESDFREAFYEMVRSEGGWAPSPISPPQARFPANEFLAAAGEDPSRTAWALREPGQSVATEDLYIRAADGTFTKVGPMVPPAGAAGPPAGEYQRFGFGQIINLRGGSDDLSHLFFTLANKVPRWPGDTTGEEPSLYEYVGTGNTHPDLVGVSDGDTTINGEPVPAGALLSDCKTFLGSTGPGEASEDAYNAVSADGSKVYFTAGGHEAFGCPLSKHAPDVSEIYARFGQEQTVPISEPLPRDCVDCNLSVRKPAEYRGASRDGSKAFFLSEQEYFPGDETTNLYEYDFSNPEGEKLIRASGGALAPRVRGVVRVSEDGSRVYFVAEGVLAGENRAHMSPVEGGDNLYVFERDAAHPDGRVAFVGTLAPGDEGDWIGFDLRAAQASPDGRFLVFESVADLTAGDSSAQQQVFEYDALTETLVRVSVGQTGYGKGFEEADAHASLITSQNYAGRSLPAAAYNGLAVSADGATVVFASTGALTRQTEGAAAAGAQSVYEYHSVGAISDGDVFPISSGGDVLSGGELGAIAFGLSESGADIFFKTADQLVMQDGDTQFDIYDARRDGGFARSVTGPTAPCEGEACRGSQVVPPAEAGSELVSGTISGSSMAAAQIAGPKPTSTISTRAERLRSALKGCRKVHAKHRRRKCEARARKKYSAKTEGRRK